jgi:hypothetical protein
MDITVMATLAQVILPQWIGSSSFKCEKDLASTPGLDYFHH